MNSVTQTLLHISNNNSNILECMSANIKDTINNLENIARTVCLTGNQNLTDSFYKIQIGMRKKLNVFIFQILT